MRDGLALVLLVAVGCSVRPAPVNTETRAALPTGQFVALPRLADDLDLLYRGSNAGFIELSSPPDHVMLVEDSRRALVNGHEVPMDYPCMRRGEDYVIFSTDAARVTRALNGIRSERRPEVPPLRVLPRPVSHSPASESMPAAWRPLHGVSVRPWEWIVVHHMASGRGSAAVIHRLHRDRGYDGLGYHFVIGNGTLTGDGQIEVGYRWARQIEGAHARARAGDDNRWNRRGIGICLVGDFQSGAPSPAQLDSLTRLVRILQRTYGIPTSKVVPHRYVKATLCPGSRFPWDEFKSRLR